MTYSTVLDDLKTVLEAQDYTPLTATFHLRGETDIHDNDLRPGTLKTAGELATDKVVGIIAPALAIYTFRRASNSDKQQSEGSITLLAVSKANLKDLIGKIIDIGQDRTTDTLTFLEPAVLYAQNQEVYFALLKFRWVRVVVYT